MTAPMPRPSAPLTVRPIDQAAVQEYALAAQTVTVTDHLPNNIVRQLRANGARGCIMNRSTHQRLTLRQTRFVVRWDRILGGIVLGLAVGLFLVAGAIAGEAFGDSVTVKSGDRVCVSMLTEDGSVVPEAYHCGPLTLTTHDDIAGEDRP